VGAVAVEDDLVSTLRRREMSSYRSLLRLSWPLVVVILQTAQRIAAMSLPPELYLSSWLLRVHRHRSR